MCIRDSTQACRSLKEEGVEVVLVNSNPATIMTDKDIADKVYIEPVSYTHLRQRTEVRLGALLWWMFKLKVT